MRDNFLYLILPLLVLIAVFSIVHLRAVSMVRRFNSLKIGMTYDEVIKIMGFPRDEHDVELGMRMCTWRVRVGRGYGYSRNAFFKNGVLISLSRNRD